MRKEPFIVSLARTGVYRKSSNGYMVNRFDQFETEHRDVWSKMYGQIPDGYHIHHINGMKDDNRIENLVCMSAEDHLLAHASNPERIKQFQVWKTRAPIRKINCAKCGKEVETRSPVKKFCSHQCTVQYHNGINDGIKKASRARNRGVLACKQCAKPFTQMYSNQVYCDPNCRHAWNMDHVFSGSYRKNKRSEKLFSK